MIGSQHSALLTVVPKALMSVAAAEVFPEIGYAVRAILGPTVCPDASAAMFHLFQLAHSNMWGVSA